MDNPSFYYQLNIWQNRYVSSIELHRKVRMAFFEVDVPVILLSVTP